MVPRRIDLLLAALLVGAQVLACQPSLQDQLAEVRLQQELGAIDDAVETLREILAEHPDNPEANLLLGISQIRRGQPALAIWPLEVAGRTPDFATEANLALGGAYAQLDQYEPAIAAAERALANSTDEFPEHRSSALRLRTLVHLQTEDWAAALQDAQLALDLNPDDGEALTLRASALVGAERYEEAETALREIFEEPRFQETAVAARAGASLVRLLREDLEQPDRAREELERLLERYPSQAPVIGFAIGFFDETEDPERATALLQSAIAAEPANLRLRTILAERHADHDDIEAGEQVLVEATDLLDTPEAWLRLSEYRRIHGDSEGALVAMERTLQLVPGHTDYLRFKHAGLLADAGQLDRAEEVASQIEQPEYRDLTLGRIAEQRGEYARALELLAAGLRRWPNNEGGRYLAGRAALQLGDTERAIAEFREAVRVDAAATEAALDLARLHIAMRRPELALSALQRFLAKKSNEKLPNYGTARLLQARALADLERVTEAIRVIESVAESEEDRLAAILQLAALNARMNGAPGAIDVIRKSGLELSDPANERALRSLCDLLVTERRGEEALAEIDRALAARSDVAAFHDIRGRVILALGRGEEARASFEAALELDPEYATALAGLAHLAQEESDVDRAVELLERAAAADPDEASYPYTAAHLELRRGRSAEARAHLEETLRRNALHTGAANDLAWLLAEESADLDRAVGLARLAARSRPSAAVLDTLGWVHFKRGEYAAAARVLAKAHELDPASPSVTYRLSLALIETGESERARELLSQALDGGAFPEAEAARAQLARLEEAG